MAGTRVFRLAFRIVLPYVVQDVVQAVAASASIGARRGPDPKDQRDRVPQHQPPWRRGRYAPVRPRRGRTSHRNTTTARRTVRDRVDPGAWRHVRGAPCVDTALDRPVAIKFLRGEGDRASIARFEREARVLARLHHPNVVTVFDVDGEGDEHFIVMELVEGPTLRDVLSAEERLSPDRAASIAADIASALGFAHANDIVHRDVKPSS